MARSEVRWERMLPHQLEAAFAACPAVYFPYGLCEPHGPQNALGLDGLKAHGLLVRTARRHGGIVAPADFWHARKGPQASEDPEHRYRRWQTTNLPSAEYIARNIEAAVGECRK